MRLPSLNRVVALLTAASGLVAAIAVPVANLDTSSMVGVLGGLTAITTAAAVWLVGWQKHEAQQARFVEMGILPPGPAAADDGNDGDDGLPAELAHRKPDSDVPEDEVDRPDGRRR